MKKIFTIISAIALSISGVSAQMPVTQGNFIIDVYAGIPNWGNILFNQDAETSNYKVKGSLLSYGGRFEYMIADNFGVGADVNYEVSGASWDYISSYYNEGTMTYTDVTYTDTYTSKKLRAMARLNYHFVQNDRIDAYAGFGGGYKNVNRTFTSTDPLSTDNNSKALIPVSFRIAVGTRIYFTNNIGAMIELGAFGGGLLQFGLSAKF